MSNLERVAGVWDNLEESYQAAARDLTKAQYLRVLLSNGNVNDVRSLLGRVAADVETEEDSMKFSSLQRIMLRLLNVYYQIPDQLDDLNAYVQSALNGNARVGDFGYLLSLINVAQVLKPSKTLFSQSETGMDIVTADSVHMLHKQEDGVLIFKALADISAFVPDDSEFQLSVRRYLDQNMPKLSAIFVKDKLILANKNVIAKDGNRYLIYNGVSANVFVHGLDI